MNTNAKIKKMLANRIQEHTKIIIQHDQVELIPGMQGWFSIWKFIKVIHYINKLENRNHVIIALDAEIFFEKIQHPVMLKVWERSEI